ncbi:MAG: DDE-type integrase/transposase/recombinase [Phycisphaerales bacterium]
MRRWRQQGDSFPVVHRGRPPRCATWEERNAVYRFLKQRGPTTPLAAVRAAFPVLRRSDLANVLRRFKQVMRRRAERFQSRLEWRRPGAVWAADFKERREPLEGRYGWIMSIKDLGSGCQLAWQPLEEATADVVSAIYARLFAEHGPPLVLKSDNGSQFKADLIKDLLADYRVVPLYSPKRHPQYNGGVERANGQVTGYQEALAQYNSRPAGPTYEDACQARQLANELAHPHGWRGPTAAQLWDERVPIRFAERAAFLATVADNRTLVRGHWQFNSDAELTHYQAAAVDRRAVRDALLSHDLLKIHPRRQRAGQANRQLQFEAQRATGAGTIESTQQLLSPPTVGGAANHRWSLLSVVRSLFRGGPFLRSKKPR